MTRTCFKKIGDNLSRGGYIWQQSSSIGYLVNHIQKMNSKDASNLNRDVINNTYFKTRK